MSTNDILQSLHQDARRLRVARKLPDAGPIPWDLTKRVQDDFVRFVEETGLSLTQIARRMGSGFSTSTLSTWRSMRSSEEFIGDRDRITRGVNTFMESYARARLAPRPNEWVETEVAKRMVNVIREAIKQRAIGVITSDSGRGKTLTLQAANSIFPGSIYLRVMRGTTSPSGLGKLIAHTLKLRGAQRMLEVQLKIIEHLSDTDRPLLIDEAHQLQPAALEFIRDLHDTCGVPVILAGTRDVVEKTTDRGIFFGQFASRIAVRYDVNERARKSGGDPSPSKPIHTLDEIRSLFTTDQLRLTDDAIHLLGKLANVEGLGGLRLCRQLVVVAATAAQGKAIDAKLLLAVLRQMHGSTHAIGLVERRVEELTLKVA